MQPEERNISIWVCREEKLVLGLSKRTTCADVVRVLLEDPTLHRSFSATMLSGSPRSYCVVEKWRGFERILPNKTKILRLWGAWGEEQEHVRFVLVKTDASLSNHGPRSAEARVVRSKESPCVKRGTAGATRGLSPEKQRRIVRKAFRKLDKINKKRAQVASRDASSAGQMETMVHLVISQDHTLRQQTQRIQELDGEIERYEANVHFDRMKRHGINYVQDTYLVEANSDARGSPEGETPCSAGILAKLEEYAQQCEELVKLQEELAVHEVFIDSITLEIQEELNQRWMKRRQEALSGEKSSTMPTTGLDPSNPGAAEHEWLLEEERVKTQLDASLYIGLRLNADLEDARNDLNLAQGLWGIKKDELRALLEKVNTLEIEDGTSSENLGTPVVTETGVICTLETKSKWVEQTRGLSKTYSISDDDSDTGLSSLHSQDSDNPLMCESLV